MNRKAEHISLHPAADPRENRHDLTVPQEVRDSWHSLLKAIEETTGYVMRLSGHEENHPPGPVKETPAGHGDYGKPKEGPRDRGAIMGFPVMWPNGEVLGMLKVSLPDPCADTSGRKQMKTMAEAVKKTMEAGLEILYTSAVIKKANQELRGAFLNRHNMNIVPVICSYCKKIKDREESWNGIEHYFHSNYQISFSHGICPDCGDELMKKI